ncbi:MAG TPA: hypothetical protein ENI66_02425 [Candidatus Yonathbacteria bacterium]|nr:hypothetical protein [Candidatus Yonathbacteria bacterium]
MKIKTIKQHDSIACGPTCIEMALQYFQIPHTIKEITNITDYKKIGGLYNKQLIKALNKLGLKTYAHINSTWEELRNFNTKNNVIILSWMLDGYIPHLSVLEKIESAHIYLSDPTSGKIIKIKKIKFLRLWLDYEVANKEMWYPKKNTDIQLRWMVVVSTK